MVIWRYEISPRVLKNISQVNAAKEWNIFQHSKRNFVSLPSHVISSVYFSACINILQLVFYGKGWEMEWKIKLIKINKIKITFHYFLDSWKKKNLLKPFTTIWTKLLQLYSRYLLENKHHILWKHLRADVSKYQPEVYKSEKSKILKKFTK